ncbi:putative KAP-like P-loop ATPase [Flavobacterium sp. CG_9.10]|uniref:helix-turn-helix domain-containing protein n=1 Tax=Flavobacterium sp. CG_9.10 TaxID=2787729 RepID=UPI0018CBC728|nr:helix-turn-helix domain-containing protein [Flavobacterium sp. CG_9.10]MBG6109345.1 putative KAP-like P-loop ATPase [Flavobacterium sp. CG_9.10]
MQTVQFISTTPDQLQSEINAGVKIILEDFLKNFKPKQPNEYLTRRHVADMFDVDISTISNWQRTGKLNPLGISGRVYFLRSEVEASLIPLNV